MNTPAHVALNALLLGRGRFESDWGAITAGSLMPDLPMVGFYLVERFGRGTPEGVIWGQLYFDPDWQANILSRPLKDRLRMAEEARRQSLEATINQSMDIMDVNQDAVKTIIRHFKVDVLLHGHTHRPAIHDVDLGRRKAKRIVLGDWYTQGSVVRWDTRGPKLESMPR